MGEFSERPDTYFRLPLMVAHLTVEQSAMILVLVRLPLVVSWQLRSAPHVFSYFAGPSDKVTRRLRYETPARASQAPLALAPIPTRRVSASPPLI